MKTKLYMLIILLISLLWISPVSAQVIESMNDLPVLDINENLSNTLESEDQYNKILVLYTSNDENNLGKLNLDSEDFESGVILDPKTDLLKISTNRNDKDALINQIRQNENVLAVDFDLTANTTASVNDPYYNNYQKIYLDTIGFESSLDLIGDYSVNIATIDTGINLEIPELSGKINSNGFNYLNNSEEIFDYNGHGTEVASVIVANSNNEIGITGVVGNNNVTITPFIALNEHGEGNLSNFVRALNEIATRDDIQIVNISAGFSLYNQVLEKACQEVYDSGKILIAASGNNNSNVLSYPAAFDSVIGVGAIDNDLTRSKSWGNDNLGSNYGLGLDFMAPGTDILAINSSNEVLPVSGTSFAAPIVSGTAALLLCNDNNLTQEEVKTILINTAEDLGDQDYDLEYGYGLIQIDKALNYLNQEIEVIDENEEIVELTDNLFHDELYYVDENLFITD